MSVADFPRVCDKSFMGRAHHEYDRHGMTNRERFGELPTLAVYHGTQGDTARGAAQWFTNPAAGGSSHEIGDGRELFKMMGDSRGAAGVACFNSHTWHYEDATSAGWTRRVWMLPANRRRMRCAAYRIARFLRRHDLPPRWVGVAELRKSSGRAHGWTTHAAAVRSGLTCSTHTDPGRFWPRRYMVRWVRRYYRRLKETH